MDEQMKQLMDMLAKQQATIEQLTAKANKPGIFKEIGRRIWTAGKVILKG